MPNLIRAIWSGASGSPAASTFSIGDTANSNVAVGATGCTAAAANIRTMFDAIKLYIPNTVTISFDGASPHLDDGTGTLTGIDAYTPPASVTGASTQSYLAPAGASIRWVTQSTVNGHLVRGRTYLVPLGSGAFAVDGTLGSAQLTTLLNAATALVVSSAGSGSYIFKVWHRPVAGSGGSVHTVTAATVKDVAAVLRSRRD